MQLQPRLAGSQIWTILNGLLGEGKVDLLISAKLGRGALPQSPSCPNTLSAVCRLRGFHGQAEGSIKYANRFQQTQPFL